LRYYLDFCVKYNQPDKSSKSLTQFLRKLSEKKQSESQQKQAGHAISLYLDLAQGVNFPESEAFEPSKTLIKEETAPAGGQSSMPCRPSFKEYSATGAAKAPWVKAISEMTIIIKTRHYSPKTLHAYEHWVWKFQRFKKDTDPTTLTTEDVKAFLSWLAVTCNVSASSQNQAFNALLFFFRHVLKRDFGQIGDVVRAKRTTYIPVVLSREEVATVIGHLYPPYALIVKTMYGCGLRLFECMKLRVHNFNFDAGVLTIHDGKGKKDRTVPLPQSIMLDLLAQLERLKKLHDQDLATDCAGVFLDHLLEKKYKNAAREFIWQWFFPQRTLTLVEETKEKRRYHVHESHVQKALRAAVLKAKLTIQTLLGHSDIKTTMIYTHCIPSKTVKEAKSPLDF
jgi:integron integrase